MAYSARLSCCFLLLLCAGCYAPLHSPGIPASSLPDHFRVPEKALSMDLNYAMLTMQTPDELQLEPNDVVKVDIEELVPRLRRLPGIGAENQQEPAKLNYEVQLRITQSGSLMLPLVGDVYVAGLTLDQAQAEIVKAYADGFIDDPRISISVVTERMTRVMVLGQVARPEVYELPKYSNDIAHALTKAGGLIADHADEIQVHRRRSATVPAMHGPEELPLNGPEELPPNSSGVIHCNPSQVPEVLRIPLRSLSPVMLSPEQVTLRDGDVVVVPKKASQVFFVVGSLSSNNLVRFSLGDESRDLGNGLLLPPDRDIDVVTAVAMAGYIDPINSPTTVTVHRTMPDGSPMLIHVDLIAARFDRNETIMVQPGDIIYLNPDFDWWFRRTLDRIIPELITVPYQEYMQRLLDPRGIN